MQKHTILTKSTPVALKSVANHIKYENCSVTGSHKSLTIDYPTFNHSIKSSDRLEFSISPGTNSPLLILWQPSVHSLCHPISSLPISHPPLTMPKYNSNLQKIAYRRMAHSRTLLYLIYEHNPVPSELKNLQFPNNPHFQKHLFLQSNVSRTPNYAFQTPPWFSSLCLHYCLSRMKLKSGLKTSFPKRTTRYQTLPL